MATNRTEGSGKREKPAINQPPMVQSVLSMPKYAGIIHIYIYIYKCPGFMEIVICTSMSLMCSMLLLIIVLYHM